MFVDLLNGLLLSEDSKTASFSTISEKSERGSSVIGQTGILVRQGVVKAEPRGED